MMHTQHGARESRSDADGRRPSRRPSSEGDSTGLGASGPSTGCNDKDGGPQGAREGAGEGGGAEEDGDGDWVTVSENAFGAFLHVSLQVTSALRPVTSDE